MKDNRTITSESTFVVSGGAKGITAQCVIKMAQRYGCMFMLLGRTPDTQAEPEWALGCGDEAELMSRIMANHNGQGDRLSPAQLQQQAQTILAGREIHATLQAIRQAGGRAEYLSVDITKPEAVRQVLAPALRWIQPITGLIHGAGVLADKLIAKKTVQDFEQVYTTKVDGLRNLLDCIEPEQLDYIVLFSSIAGFYGNVGQTDYALANAILDKAAHQLKRLYPASRVISLNWGPWDGGMVGADLKELFAQHDFKVIPSDLGAQALIDELEIGDTAPQVLVGSPISFATEQLSPVLRMLRARRSLMGMRYDQLTSQLHSQQISRRLTLDANPFLRDHVINGHAVLPATCASAWIANICEQLYPGLQFVRCDDFAVLKGIVFDEQLADQYVLSLRELRKTVEPAEVVFDALIWSKTSSGQQRYHYRAQITLRKDVPEPEIYHAFDPIDRAGYQVAPFYHDGTLFHGPSFQGAEYVLNQSDHRLTMRCRLARLSAEQQGQFPVQTLNPYVADACLQSALIWMQRTVRQLVLPLGFQRAEHFKSMEFDVPYYVSLEIDTATNVRLISNLVVHDEQARIHLRLLAVEGTVLRSVERPPPR